MATRTKEKAAARKANADKRPQAHARFVRISPRKVKIVIDLIRGKNVDEALAIATLPAAAAAHPRCSSAPATSAWCWTRSKAKEEKTWVRK